MTTFDGQSVPGADAPVPTWRRWGLRLSYVQAVALLVGLLLGIRLVVLFIADYDLNPDEAQYWSWSQDLAFGYFSKPPMIAWIIALTTGVFGHGEAVVRLAAPLLHAGTALVVFALARSLYDERAGFWSALVYVTAPAVWFSSGLITTDVPLLLFWSLALLALHRTLETRSMAWAAVLGAAVGLGMLSKYAMIYFILCGGLYFGVSRGHSWFLWSRQGAVAVLIAALLILPNIVWNLEHGMATLGHTASNANWGSERFNFDELLEFTGAQFGVFGPILFGALIWGALTLRGRIQSRADVYLVCFVLPILAIAMLQAFISRANANWAAPAYVAASILVVAWLMRRVRMWWAVPASVAIHTVLGLVLCALILSPGLLHALGRDNDFKQVRGWEAIGTAVAETADSGYGGTPYSAVLTDDRFVHAALLYYARPHQQPLVMWNRNAVAQNHFELTVPFKPDLGATVLFTTPHSEEDAAGILFRFDRHRLLETIEVPIGGSRTRTIRLFALQDYRGGPDE
jgi:4-amino-4-deoxy-L-arabinose transferase-like glycosyltransferase